MGPNTTIRTAAIGGAMGVVIVWILTMFGIVVPDTVAGAIATLCAVSLGWIVPVKAKERSKK
jgi:hypothetical protein